MVEVSLPSKIFLLGEYAVLSGHPAWVAAIEPRFSFRSGGTTTFHPESPAGLLLASFSSAKREAITAQLAAASFVDPWSGQGGFGASTAEFATVAYLAGIVDAREAHRIYRDLHRGPNPPSGADLVAQWEGGVLEFRAEGSSYGARSLGAAISEASWVIFSATHQPHRKTKTHTHLASETPRTKDDYGALAPILELARSGLDRRDWRTLGTALTRYAESLQELGLEIETTHADRMALAELPGVLGAKGCGALQSDAVLVLLEDSSFADEVIRFGEEERGLKLLSRGLSLASGLRVEGRAK